MKDDEAQIQNLKDLCLSLWVTLDLYIFAPADISDLNPAKAKLKFPFFYLRKVTNFNLESDVKK